MSKNRDRVKAKGRADGWVFVRMPTRMLRDKRFQQLSAHASKVILYVAAQYDGGNNGDLHATWKIAKSEGWSSKANLQKGLREAIDAGFVRMTRQGGRNQCSLYALTWFAIDFCQGKLDVAATKVAPNDWEKNNSSAPPVGQCAPRVGQSGPNRRGAEAPLPHGWGSQAHFAASIAPPVGTSIDLPWGSPVQRIGGSPVQRINMRVPPELPEATTAISRPASQPCYRFGRPSSWGLSRLPPYSAKWQH